MDIRNSKKWPSTCNSLSNMLQFTSKYFGPIECAHDAVVAFPVGLPGFEPDLEFVFLDRPYLSPLVFMQSIRRQDVCFLALPVLAVDPRYSLSMSRDDLEAVSFTVDRQPRIGDEALCLALLTTMEGVVSTVNLRSPIVVNLNNRQGIQSIQTDSEYSFWSPLRPQAEVLSC